MTQMPIRVTVIPSALNGQANGAITPSLLGRVDRDGYLWQMAALPARGMRAMRAAIYKDLGITLDTTGRGRSLAIQWSSFGGAQARYRPCTKAEYDVDKLIRERTKFWPPNDYVTSNGPAPGRHHVAQILNVTIPDSDYWTKIRQPNGSYPATSAVPGTSPHGWWCADDLALPDGADLGTGVDPLTPIVLEWLYSHELAYGFAHSTTTEPWHVQWFMGDTVPAAVLAAEQGQKPPPTAENPPAIPNPPPEVDEMAELIQVNDDAAVLFRDGLVCTSVREQVVVDSLFEDKIIATTTPRQLHRKSLKAFELRGPPPSYDGYTGPKPGRTVASDFVQL